MNLVQSIIRKHVETLERIGSFSESTQKIRPSPSSWSLLEVIEHLVIVEERILTMIAKSLSETPRRASIFASARMALYIFVIRRPIKIPAPIEAIKPSGKQNFQQLKSRWGECETQWLKYFSDASIDPQRALFNHPLGGWFTLKQSGRFVVEHINHHHFQLARIESSITLD